MKRVRRLLVGLLVACFLCNNIVYAETNDVNNNESQVIEDNSKTATDAIGVEEVELVAEMEEQEDEGSFDLFFENEIQPETSSLNEGEKDEGKVVNDDEFVLNYLASDYDLSALDHLGNHDYLQNTLPESYSLRTDGLVSPIRNQGAYGTCWSFATMASAESNAIKKGLTSNPDFSELHLAYFMYNSVTDPLGLTKGDYTKTKVVSYGNLFNAGGDIQMASILLSGGAGFVNESVLPYSKAASIMAGGYKPADSLCYNNNAFYLSEARWIDMTERDYVKKVIMEHGAVATAYYDSATYYNGSSAGYYCPDERAVNHGIAIVGWDDNFSKNNFNRTPAGNGAWLVKNSWGTGGRNGGYFWISYYDFNMQGVAVGFEVDQFNDINNIYQYDGTSIVSFLQFTVNNVRVANNYVAQDNEVLEKVGFFSGVSDVDYNVMVYLNSDEKNPTSGQLVSSTKGKTEFAGYCTVDLSKSVYLNKGTKFSIVIELKAETRKTVGILTDSTSDNTYYSFHNETAEYQSMYQYVGRTTWNDMAKSNRSARIKAYTFKTNLRFAKDSVEVYVGETATNKLNLEGTFQYVVADNSIASVDSNGVVTGLKEGQTSVSVTTEEGMSCSYQLTVKNPFVFNGDTLVEYKGNLKSVEIPEGTIEIGANSFADKGIEQVTIPDSVKILGDYCFKDNAITEVVIGEAIIHVGDGAYQGNELKTIDIRPGERTFGDGALPIGANTIVNLPAEDWIDVEAVEPTCTKPGHSAGHCYKYMPSYNDFEEIAPLGHDFNDYVDDGNSTCVSYGTETAKCSRCEMTDVRLTTVMGSHQHSEKEIGGIRFDFCPACRGLRNQQGVGFVAAKPKMTTSDIAKLINIAEEEEYTVTNDRSGRLATGTKLTIERLGGNVETFLFYVYGDVNGDSEVNSLDYVFVKNHIMKTSEIKEEANILAADYNGDELINSLDYVSIKNYIMNGGK